MKYRGFNPRTRVLRWGAYLLVVGAVIAVTGPGAIAMIKVWVVQEHDKLPWYGTRLFGMLSYLALTLSVLYGLLLSTGILDALAHRVVSFTLHQDLAAIGLSLAMVHGALLMLDTTMPLSPLALLVPFEPAYRPLWVGIGQIALYLMAIVYFSFHVRRSLGQRGWRLIHYLTFLAFAGATAHGLMSGTDTSAPWAFWSYVVATAAVTFLFMYRIVMAMAGPNAKAPGRPDRMGARAPAAGGALPPRPAISGRPAVGDLAGRPVGAGSAARGELPPRQVAAPRPGSAALADLPPRPVITPRAGGTAARAELPPRPAVAPRPGSAALADLPPRPVITPRPGSAALADLPPRPVITPRAGGAARVELPARPAVAPRPGSAALADLPPRPVITPRAGGAAGLGELPPRPAVALRPASAALADLPPRPVITPRAGGAAARGELPARPATGPGQATVTSSDADTPSIREGRARSFLADRPALIVAALAASEPFAYSPRASQAANPRSSVSGGPVPARSVLAALPDLPTNDDGEASLAEGDPAA